MDRPRGRPQALRLKPFRLTLGWSLCNRLIATMWIVTLCTHPRMQLGWSARFGDITAEGVDLAREERDVHKADPTNETCRDALLCHET